MAVIGDKYDNFKTEVKHYAGIVRPKYATITSFEGIEEGDYIVHRTLIPGTNNAFDTYYQIQKKIGKATLVIFCNDANIRFRFIQSQDGCYAKSSLPIFKDVALIKFEDYLEFCHLQELRDNMEDYMLSKPK